MTMTYTLISAKQTPEEAALLLLLGLIALSQLRYRRALGIADRCALRR